MLGWRTQDCPCRGGRPVARIEIVSIRRESLSELHASLRYVRAELKSDLWRDAHEFIALFSKAKHGNPYRIEFRLFERLI